MESCSSQGLISCVELGLAASLTQEEAEPGDPCDFNIQGTKRFLLYKRNSDCSILPSILPLQDKRSPEAQALRNHLEPKAPSEWSGSGAGEGFLPLGVCWLVFHTSFIWSLQCVHLMPPKSTGMFLFAALSSGPCPRGQEVVHSGNRSSLRSEGRKSSSSLSCTPLCPPWGPVPSKFTPGHVSP